MRFETGIYHKDQEGARFPVPYCTIHKLSHNETFMGEDYVTVSAELPYVRDGRNAGKNLFMVGDWLVYRGIRYVIDVPPTVQKSARVNRRGNSITYDSVKFINKLCLDLMYLEFRDVTNGTEHYNFAARSFTFYCASLYNFAEKLKANIDRRYEGQYRVYVHATDGGNYLVGGSTTMPSGVTAVGKDNITVSASDQKCWDALSHVKEDFDVNFIVAKDNDGVLSLFLGCNGKLLSQQHFSYGRFNGLFKIERTTDDSQAIVTRLRAYGAETNMPARYYKNINIRYYVEANPNTLESIGKYYATGSDRVSAIIGEKEIILTVEERNALYELSGGTHNVYYMPTLKRSMFKNVNEATSMAEVTLNNLYSCKVFAPVGSDTTLQTAVFLFTNEQACVTYISDCYNNRSSIYFTGGINKGSWSVAGMIADSTNLPNNMNVKCLMLPGFGRKSLYDTVREAFGYNPTSRTYASSCAATSIRVLKDYCNTLLSDNGFGNFTAKYGLSQDLADPWIEANNQVSAYGVREGYAVFDDSNEDYDPIYPSLQYLGVDTNLLPAQSWTADGETYNNNLRVDNGIVDDLVSADMEIPQWYLYVKDPGFDPYEQRKEGESTITVHIKDGMVGGRDFTCYASAPVTLSDGTSGYRLTLERVEDSSLDLFFPYRASGTNPVDFVPKEGDEIVYIDIEMPDEYVEKTALYELLPAALETLDENCDVRYKFNLTIDKEQMARQHIEARHSGGTIDSLHDTMRAGDVLVFGDSDLGVSYNEGIAEDEDTITAAILIESVEIRENEERLPEYSVTLVDQENVSSIEKMQKQIDSIVNGSISVSTTGGGTGGYSAGEIQNLIKTYGGKWYLSKLKDDEAAGHITFKRGFDSQADSNISGDLTLGGVTGSSEFETGILGTGWRIDNAGHAQMESLSLRKFLEVPELRYNRTEVHVGVDWQTHGAGLIEDVAQLTETTGIIKLKLEDGEIGAVAVDDYCMGIFHNVNPGETNASENVDSHNGNFEFAGFQTVYFKVTSFCDEEGNEITAEAASQMRNQYFLYELRPVTESDEEQEEETPDLTAWSEQNHPQPSMSFACYANPNNSERQSCIYATTDYVIMLTGMTDWTYGGSNIAYIRGKLDGFTIPAERQEWNETTQRWETVTYNKPLEGYGVAFGNAYMWGNIDQFDRPAFLVTQQLYQMTTTDTLAEVLANPDWDDVNVYPWSTESQEPTPSAPYLYSYWLQTFSDNSTNIIGPSLSGYDNTLFTAILNKDIISLALSDWFVDGDETDNLEFDVEGKLMRGMEQVAVTRATASSTIDGFRCNPIGVDIYGIAHFHVIISGFVAQQVESVLAENNYITFRLYSGDNYAEHTLAVVENRQGDDGEGGEDALLYSLETSRATYSHTDNNTIDVRLYRSIGGSREACYGYFVFAMYDKDGNLVGNPWSPGRVMSVTGWKPSLDEIVRTEITAFAGGSAEQDMAAMARYVGYLMGRYDSYDVEPVAFTSVTLSEPIIDFRLSQDGTITYPLDAETKIPEENSFTVYARMYANSVKLTLTDLECDLIYGSTEQGVEIAQLDGAPNENIDFETINAEVSSSSIQMFRITASAVYGGRTYTMSKNITFCAVTAGVSAQGDQGIQGCVIRLRGKYSDTEFYVNQSDTTEPIPDEQDGIRYIDVVQYADGGTTKWYQRKPYSDEYAPGIDPTVQAYWSESNAFEFIATQLLLADYANIKFGQGNQLLIMAEDGETIVGGLTGFDRENPSAYRLWIGAERPQNAPFSVTHEGELIAANVNSHFQDVSYCYSNGEQQSGSGYEPMRAALNLSDIKNGTSLRGEQGRTKEIKPRIYNLIANGTKIVLPTALSYVGTRILICNTSDNFRLDDTAIVMDTRKVFLGTKVYGLVQEQTTRSNAGTRAGESSELDPQQGSGQQVSGDGEIDPQQGGDYVVENDSTQSIWRLVTEDVTIIDFCDGVMEFIAVPDDDGLTCVWSLLNKSVSEEYLNGYRQQPNYTKQ